MYVALIIQHAMRMRRIILTTVFCLTLPYISTTNKKTARLTEKCYWTWNLCFNFPCKICLKNFSF